MIRKKDFIWNTFSSVISSLFSAILLAFCTRINGLEIAGIFSITYATACILNSIGDFGTRIYQVTDVERKNNFSEYLVARIFSVSLMVIIGLIFILFSGYRHEKLIICILLIAFRVIENLSETYQAEFQLNERLEFGGKSVVYRNLSGFIVFLILDLITKEFIISLTGLVLTNFIIFILYDLKVINKFTKVNFNVNKKNVALILKECLPLAISTLISMYVINAVKYAIDANGDYAMQTYFNIIYMPTFVINLTSGFIIKAFLKPFGDRWNSKEYSKFLKAIIVIIVIVILFTIVVEIGCYLLGIPFLNAFYGVDLSMYKSELLLLILSGLLYAIANLFFNILGTVRAQKTTTISYIITAIIALFVPKKLVSSYGMRGAVFSNLIIMGALCSLMLIFFVVIYIKNVREDKNTNNRKYKLN